MQLKLKIIEKEFSCNANIIYTPQFHVFASWEGMEKMSIFLQLVEKGSGDHLTNKNMNTIQQYPDARVTTFDYTEERKPNLTGRIRFCQNSFEVFVYWPILDLQAVDYSPLCMPHLLSLTCLSNKYQCTSALIEFKRS